MREILQIKSLPTVTEKICIHWAQLAPKGRSNQECLSHEPENNKESASLSKKAAKKEKAKLEKLRRRQEHVTAALAQSAEPEDPLAANYGDVPLHLESMNMVALTSVGALTEALKDQKVVIRGSVQTIRTRGKKMAFIVVEKEGFTVQCVVTVQPEIVSPQMVKYVSKLTRESIIYIEGILSKPDGAITGASVKNKDSR